MKPIRRWTLEQAFKRIESLEAALKELLNEVLENDPQVPWSALDRARKVLEADGAQVKNESPPKEPPVQAQVVDLMAALKASLAAKKTSK